MSTRGRRWAFFAYVTAGAIGAGYAAAAHVGDASTPFRIATGVIVLAGLVVCGVCVYRVTGDRAARLQRRGPKRGTAAATGGIALTLSAALSGMSAGWQMLSFTASCVALLALAASLPFIDRELRRRERADREWMARRPEGGR